MLTDDFFLPTKRDHATLTELCQPLADYLGITKTWYMQIDAQGKGLAVTNDVTWMHQFIDQEYYKIDPIMVHPRRIGHGFFFINDLTDRYSTVVYDVDELNQGVFTLDYDAQVNFQWYHAFGYIEKIPKQGFWVFYFATTRANCNIRNVVFNSGFILKIGIRSLQKKLSTVLIHDEAQVVDLAALKGRMFYSQPGRLLNNISVNKQKLHAL